MSHSIDLPTIENALNSDHFPVLFSIKTSNVCKRQNLIYNYKKTNWKKFNSHINASILQSPLNLRGIENTRDIDECILHFTNTILSAIEVSTPKRIVVNNCIKLPFYILEAIKKRNYFRQKWNRYRHVNDKLVYKEYDRLVKYEIWSFRNNSWNSSIKKLDIRSKPFWNISKMLKKKISNIPPISVPNSAVPVVDSKSTIFAQQFLCNHHTSDDIRCQNTEQSVLKSLDDFNNSFFSTPDSDINVSTTTVKNIIRNLKVNKSCGLDNLKNLFLNK